MRAPAIVTLGVLLAAPPALAQPGQTPPTGPAPVAQPPPPPMAYPTMKQTRRYGSKIATADGLSVGGIFIGAMVFAMSITDDDGDDAGAIIGAGLMIGGGLGLMFGGPLIHNREGNTSGAWKSLAIRVGIPVLGGLIMSATVDESCDVSADEDCDRSANTVGSLMSLAWIGGIVLDWFVLAKVEVDAPVYPYAAPAPYGGVTLGLGGAL